MAAAQKKRWQLLKAKKAPAKKTKPTGGSQAPQGYGSAHCQETARPGKGGKEGHSEVHGTEGRSQDQESGGEAQSPGIGYSCSGGS
jgi:hypothetical protein